MSWLCKMLDNHNISPLCPNIVDITVNRNDDWQSWREGFLTFIHRVWRGQPGPTQETSGLMSRFITPRSSKGTKLRFLGSRSHRNTSTVRRSVNPWLRAMRFVTTEAEFQNRLTGDETWCMRMNSVQIASEDSQLKKAANPWTIDSKGT